ncbi:MAG: coproporphyrinogen dehydrogenase HemZ, partial [Acutalibacteraceae bacterium]|nr:coproporphyrinogen dehydrogenase HemZ [Acutalibacteraceae bacterium]
QKAFCADYLANANKISLCKEAHEGENKIISLSSPMSYSLYLSVPFCPSRCSYCSFVSHSIERAQDMIPQYVEYLLKELEITAKIAKQNNLKLETVYMGGGTPTTLSADELKTVLSAVRKNFDMSAVREFTVEAGRPDTITAEKLAVIKQCGATRISINPQTLNDDVLKAIGRNHTSQQTVDAFNLARSMGFDNINMDLIAGLPCDTVESFAKTLDGIIALDPESVTVHALSMKRASTLNAHGDFPELEAGRTAAIMVDTARKTLTERGILPYYMYRQSKTVGNLENVGYAKKGFEGLYNVYIMDETHTILACGASAVTKLKAYDTGDISRIFNFKYPYEYIGRFEEQIQRKEGIGEFYDKHFGAYKQ